jgi:hypothetical protein
MRAARKATADEVARVIYDAATDGTDRLRYFTEEDVGNFVQAKRQMSEQDYVNFMRAPFLPPA